MVVANAGDASELVAALAEPLPGGPVEVTTGDGGDDTLHAFAARRPDVVVVAASLDAGDARALIAAMREAGPLHVVLVGDARGPIRNALDASDFAVDRFVARPLSAKALRFAVGSGLGAMRTGFSATPTGEGRVRRGSMIGRAITQVPPNGTHGPGVAVADLATAGVAAAVPIAEVARVSAAADVAVTSPVAVHDAPTRPVSPLRARWEALADALELDDEPDASISPPPVIIRPRRAQTEPGVPPPPPRAPTEDLGRAGDDWDTPPPPVREPTVIIPEPVLQAASERAARPTPAPPLVAPAALAPPIAPSSAPTVVLEPGPRTGPDLAALRERHADLELAPYDHHHALDDDELDDEGVPDTSELDLTERHADGRWTAAASVLPVGDEDTGDRRVEGAGLGDDLDDLSVDGPGPADDDLVSDEHVVPAHVEAPPSGTGFARELRQKMSLMAQRLFRHTTGGAAGDGSGAPGDGPPVAIGPAHDHNTEIDLAAIAEPAPATAAGGPVDFDSDGTFAGGARGHGSAARVTQTGSLAAAQTQSRRDRTSETGVIQRGTADAPALIARLAAIQFTGRLVLRRGAVEKSISFDAGRPAFATSNLDSDRMGQLLVREGKITAEQFARCDAAVRDTGRRMGEILVDKGYLKRRELLPAVRRHVEDILYSTFAWDQGEYRIVAGEGAEAERIRLSRDPAAMVLEGVRRKLDRASLERLVGSPSTIIEVGDRERLAAAVAAADLGADERAAVAAIDGKTDLARLAEGSGATELTLYALVWALMLLGVVAARRTTEIVADDDTLGMVGETDLAIDRERVRARHRLVGDADYFALLGVRRDATSFEIRRAYEAARKDFAAEGFPPELRRELAPELADIAHVLDEAFRVLRDDRLRSEYLAHLVD